MHVLTNSLRPAKAWDRWGVIASASCVVHCIVTPFAALALPALAATDGATHMVLGVAVALFALLAFIPGMKMHGKRRVLALGMTGVTLIWIAVLLPEKLVSDALRDGVTVAGGLVMVAAHVFNVMLCRRCTVCCSACNGAAARQATSI